MRACLLLPLCLGACAPRGVPTEVTASQIEEALAGPSALLYGLCPEAPPLGHDSFTGLTELQLTLLNTDPSRLRVAVRGVPLAPTDQGEMEQAAARCEGELEATFSRSSEPRLLQLRLLRGRLPGATLR